MKLDRKEIKKAFSYSNLEKKRNPVNDTLFLFSATTIVAFQLYQMIPTAETMAFFYSMLGGTAAVAALDLGIHLRIGHIEDDCGLKK